ncbi:MAG: hypothetical protein R2874_07520 [Desulfobacterales bacterium]
MGTSHLIMGILTDYLTGQTLPDTHDERILQKVARFLVDDKGYDKADIFARKTMTVAVPAKPAPLRCISHSRSTVFPLPSSCMAPAPL